MYKIYVLCSLDVSLLLFQNYFKIRQLCSLRQDLFDNEGAKEGCNWGHGLSAAIKLGSLEKTVIASLFHSGLHSGTIFLWKKRCHMLFWGTTGYAVFRQKKDQNFLWCQIDFLIIFNFFVLTIFWSAAKQRFCFRESMSVLDQNGRIQALGFLARWRLTSHALHYNIP